MAWLRVTYGLPSPCRFRPSDLCVLEKTAIGSSFAQIALRVLFLNGWVCMWNSFPLEIRLAPTSITFQKLLTIELFQSLGKNEMIPFAGYSYCYFSYEYFIYWAILAILFLCCWDLLLTTEYGFIAVVPNLISV